MADQTRMSAIPLNEGTSVEIVNASDWIDVILIHIGDGSGNIVVSSQGKAEAGSFQAPPSVAIGPFRLSPGSKLNALSTGGNRTLGVIVSPAPYTEKLLARLDSLINNLAFAISCMLGKKGR